jgi:hypothetical protein
MSILRVPVTYVTVNIAQEGVTISTYSDRKKGMFDKACWGPQNGHTLKRSISNCILLQILARLICHTIYFEGLNIDRILGIFMAL